MPKSKPPAPQPPTPVDPLDPSEILRGGAARTIHLRELTQKRIQQFIAGRVATVKASTANLDGDPQGDACDPDDGLILLFRTDPAWIEWQDEQSYDAFNVYQCDLSALRASGACTQAPGSNALASAAAA